jgi:murein DD-endopeptidase MepM/ murein hydrolase activator NlpD
VRIGLAVLLIVSATVLAAPAPAQAPARASAEAAVVTGSLGRVARARVSGTDSMSSSIPARTPDGILLGDGFVFAQSSVENGVGTARATAEADDVELFGGAVTAELVTRTASAKRGRTTYSGSVRGLVVGGREIGSVRSKKAYEFEQGTVVVNAGGAGLTVTLTAALEGHPAGTKVVIADVSASAADGAQPTPTPTPTRTPRAPQQEPERESTPDPEPTSEPGSEPRRPREPSYKRRLMSRDFVFPVGGPTRIGSPFGAARPQGAHQGNDLFADFGTPVVAVADGMIAHVGSLPISGNRLWLYADSGDQFFYAHLATFAPAAVNGRHVSKGTVLGYLGNTGDAEPTPPHLHFEIHPNGGDAIDPNPFLVAWQKRQGPALRDTAARPGALVEVRDFIGEG